MAKGWLLLFAFLLPLAGAVPCHPDDLRALRGFAGSLSGKGILSLRAAWAGVSCCGWEGVGCDAASGRVTALQLPGRGLAGPIVPSWIGELDHLCYLDLSDNSLIGEVPKTKSLQMQLKGVTTVTRSLGMASTNRRALQQQPNTIAGTNNKVIFGSNNVLDSGNDNTVKSGNDNTVSGSNNTVVSGSGNTISGSNHVVSGNNHIVTGDNNEVSGNTNIVSGSFEKVSGSNNIVSGSHNTVTGSNDNVSGSNHVVPESNRVVTGG